MSLLEYFQPNMYIADFTIVIIAQAVKTALYMKLIRNYIVSVFLVVYN